MAFSVFDVPFDNLSKNQLDALLRGWISGYHQKMIVTPNAEFLLKAQREPSFKEALQRADLSLPDTVSIRFAAAAAGDSMRFRHTGIDTLHHLAQICDDHGKRMMLFGGAGESAKLAARSLRQDHAALDVVGLNPGVIDHQKGEIDQDIVDLIEYHLPEVVAVGLSFGQQEQFMLDYLPHLSNTKIVIGVGGAFEMIGGTLPRAPQWMQRSGLEWLWRVGIEPSRVSRIYDASVRFPAAVAYDTLRRGQFIGAVRRVAPEIFKQLIGR